MKDYAAIKKREILPCATTRMGLKHIMLSGTSQTGKGKHRGAPRMVTSEDKTCKQVKHSGLMEAETKGTVTRRRGGG